jgi:hypothetical protein
MATTLQDYLDASRRLLRDASGTLYPQTDLIAYIAQARHVRDLDTRMVRKFVGYTLTANVGQYSLASISSTGTFLYGETACIGKDWVYAQVLTQGGTPGGLGFRYPLKRRATSFFAPYRTTSWVSYPEWGQLYGVDAFVLGPIPAFGYPIEMDLVGIYPDLTMVTDVEPMPDPYNDPLPYLAASVAKTNAQRFDEAKTLKEQYKTLMREVREGVRQLQVADPYFGR